MSEAARMPADERIKRYTRHNGSPFVLTARQRRRLHHKNPRHRLPAFFFGFAGPRVDPSGWE